VEKSLAGTCREIQGGEVMCEYCEKRKIVLCYFPFNKGDSSIFNHLNQVLVTEDVWLNDFNFWKICETDKFAPPRKLPLLYRIWKFFYKKCPMCDRNLSEAHDAEEM
jgi:hypothetical protein